MPPLGGVGGGGEGAGGMAGDWDGEGERGDVGGWVEAEGGKLREGFVREEEDKTGEEEREWTQQQEQRRGWQAQHNSYRVAHEHRSLRVLAAIRHALSPARRLVLYKLARHIPPHPAPPTATAPSSTTLPSSSAVLPASCPPAHPSPARPSPALPAPIFLFPFDERWEMARCARMLAWRAPFEVELGDRHVGCAHGEVRGEWGELFPGGTLIFPFPSSFFLSLPLFLLALFPPCSCVVRGVDASRGVAHVVAPLPLARMHHVDTLLISHLHLPSPLLLVSLLPILLILHLHLPLPLFLVSPYLCSHPLAYSILSLTSLFLFLLYPTSTLQSLFPQCNDLVSPYLCFHSLADAPSKLDVLPSVFPFPPLNHHPLSPHPPSSSPVQRPGLAVPLLPLARRCHSGRQGAAH
ncbi:unnamed protein product [Closterium sp. Naga37s-1]|nr:unnamed protein product [Closterium sp. Naga37s-1]